MSPRAGPSTFSLPLLGLALAVVALGGLCVGFRWRARNHAFRDRCVALSPGTMPAVAPGLAEVGGHLSGQQWTGANLTGVYWHRQTLFMLQECRLDVTPHGTLGTTRYGTQLLLRMPSPVGDLFRASLP